MISFKNVHYRYEPEGIEALRGVSLEIKDHEHVVLIGPNGCGKTTFIQHLNALLLPAVGSVTVDGLDTQQAHNHAKIRTLVGMVFKILIIKLSARLSRKMLPSGRKICACRRRKSGKEWQKPWTGPKSAICPCAILKTYREARKGWWLLREF